MDTTSAAREAGETAPPAGDILAPRPEWRLPAGVARGSWDYFRSASIAEDYDAYFAYNSLFEFDVEVLERHFREPGWVADLGCGTGRALLPLVRAGHRGLAVDLSPHMLRMVQEKAEQEGLAIRCVLANLVDLDPIRDGAVDYAMCLFSTLGMIRGRANRRRALAQARRIVREDGRFVLHVHNYWFTLRDPEGPWLLVKNLAAMACRRDRELGDKWFPYRGLPNMYLHIFRWSELAADLQATGWQIVERICLDVERRRPLRRPWWFGPLRTNGWIVVCRPEPR